MRKSTNSHLDFRNQIRILKLAALMCLLPCLTNLVAAQPTQDMEQLQAEMKAIMNKMEKMSNEQDPFVDQKANSRVKSVGSHKSKKKVRPRVDDYEMLIQLYDLSDIFVVSPNYPAVLPNELAQSGRIFSQTNASFQSGGFGGGGQGGGGGGGVFSIPSRPMTQEPAPGNIQSAQVSLNQLVAAIQQTVSPDKWGDDEDEAKIQFLGNTLLITATEDMHRQISNLLDLFRSHWGRLRTVSIQTYWIRADEGQAKTLLTGEHQEATGAGVVETEKWKKFLEAAESEKRLAYSTTLTGHNNQTLHAISGRQRQLTVGARPVRSSTTVVEGEDEDMKRETKRAIVGFQPIQTSIHDGAAIQVTPLATRGGNFVVVDLHAKVNELVVPEEGQEPPASFAYTQNGEKAEVKFDSTEYIGYRLSTTVRCPKEEVVLAGSMTFDSSSELEQPNLYLFVKATVHTIKEDKSDWEKPSHEPAK